VHSSTKYLGGHSDILGGAVVSSVEFSRSEEIRNWQITAGAVPSPFDCWMMIRSLKTLDVRLKRQVENAERLAERLAAHPKVSKVYYPGLSESVIKGQMLGKGAMISFEIDGDWKQSLHVVNSSKLILRATSLGGVESTWEHRKSTEGELSKTPETLIRLSVGIENINDLWTDISQALTAVD
jgi:cystathionine gamma-synthase